MKKITIDQIRQKVYYQIPNQVSNQVYDRVSNQVFYQVLVRVCEQVFSLGSGLEAGAGQIKE